MNTSDRGSNEWVIILVIGAVLVIGVVAYSITRNDGTDTADLVTNIMVPDNAADNENTAAATPPPITTASGTVSGSVQNDSDVAFTLQLEDLSVEQRAFLKLRGIDGDEIQVTNRMLSCAEGKLGRDRVVAIRNGASMSMGEKVDLLGCYE
ncbi:hypothetical protein K2Q16_03355 [Patescibacteria group bacterium]|nr:hypothetical protein [Patescibacteria group bacterium]